MDSIIEEAFVSAIRIEKRILDFYRAALLKVSDTNIGRIFDQLAKEELEHLGLLCNMYRRDSDELGEILNEASMFGHPYYCSMLELINFDISEIEILKIALIEEQASIVCYSKLLNIIRDHRIHNVFAHILDETHKQNKMISEEYMHHLNMVHMTDQDVYARG